MRSLIGAEEKSAEERNRSLEEEFGSQELGNQAGGDPPGVVALADGETYVPRGGSRGSASGTAVKGGKDNDYLIWRGDLATAGSDLQFEIIYKQVGSQLHFRCFLQPYDGGTASLFRQDKGDILLSFYGRTGEKMVPKEGAYPLPLTKMSAFEARGQVAGWVARGVIPLEEEKVADLNSVKLAWDFDKDLSDWLKELKRTR